MRSRFRMIGLTTVFLSVILFPLLNVSLGLIPDTKNFENRAMSPKPVFDINLLDPYPSKFEKYYNDNFSLRSLIIKYYNLLTLKLFKKSPLPDNVIIGNNGWLYLAGNEMKTYIGKERLSILQLEEWRTELENQKRYLEKRGCKFYFMVTPSKANIHSENIPYAYYQFNAQSWGEQLIEYLQKYSDINVISLYESFKDLKKHNQLYYKIDNHWNKKGAFFAANIVCERINRDFPNVKPLSISDFIVNEFPKTKGDIAYMLSNPELFPDLEFEFISKKTQKEIKVDTVRYSMGDGKYPPNITYRSTKDSKKPKLLMTSDSFSRLMFPFLAESFNKSINIFDYWHYHLNKDIVNYEKPDVYLLMIFEPWLTFQTKSGLKVGE